MNILTSNPQKSPKNEQKKRRKAYLRVILSNQIDRNSVKPSSSSLAACSLQNQHPLSRNMLCFSQLLPSTLKLYYLPLKKTPFSLAMETSPSSLLLYHQPKKKQPKAPLSSKLPGSQLPQMSPLSSLVLPKMSLTLFLPPKTSSSAFPLSLQIIPL